MPTPHGTRGGMAFGAEELRVLRRALALAVHSRPASAEDVQDCLRLAESLDEAMREGARLRAFLLADLARYRAALPGTAAVYPALLKECLHAGHRPTPDDVTALQALRGNPTAASLLPKARTAVPTARTAPAGQAARTTASGPAADATHPAPATPPSASPAASGASAGPDAPACPAARAARPQSVAAAGPAGHPVSVAGGRGPGPAAARGLAGTGDGEEPDKEPTVEPGERPAPARPGAPEPGRRPVPTPGEVFPRRKPGAPPEKPRQRLAVV